MEQARFDDYITRVNARDTTAFDEYIHPELRMQNGRLVFHGVQGMKDHYACVLEGRFGDIRVAYLSFAHTAPDGTVTQRGLAH